MMIDYIYNKLPNGFIGTYSGSKCKLVGPAYEQKITKVSC